MFDKLSFTALIPSGTDGAISGAPNLFGILIFGASECLGGMYEDKIFLVLQYYSSSDTNIGVGVVISFTFCFLLLVCFPHEVPDGPGWSAFNFVNGVTGGTGIFSRT